MSGELQYIGRRGRGVHGKGGGKTICRPFPPWPAAILPQYNLYAARGQWAWQGRRYVCPNLIHIPDLNDSKVFVFKKTKG